MIKDVFSQWIQAKAIKFKGVSFRSLELTASQPWQCPERIHKICRIWFQACLHCSSDLFDKVIMVGGMLCGHFILTNLIIFSWTSNYFLDPSNSDYWSDKYEANQNCVQQGKIEKLRNQVQTNLPQCALEPVGFSSHSYLFRSHPDRSNFFTQRSVLMIKEEKRKRLISARWSLANW